MSAKRDILKQIEDAVNKKKALAKEISIRKRDVLSALSEFFDEYQRVHKMEQAVSLAVAQLAQKLYKFDPKCSLVLKEPTDGEPKVEIYWSSTYAAKLNCEPISVYDAASVYLQQILEE